MGEPPDGGGGGGPGGNEGSFLSFETCLDESEVTQQVINGRGGKQNKKIIIAGRQWAGSKILATIAASIAQDFLGYDVELVELKTSFSGSESVFNGTAADVEEKFGEQNFRV